MRDAHDVRGILLGTHAIEIARDAEIWRPSIASPVLERIARTRGRRRERTIGAFGWAIALSLVTNVAFASGITNGSFAAFRHTGDVPSDVTATTIHFERARPKTFAVATDASARVPRHVAKRARAARPPSGLTRRIARANGVVRAIAQRPIDDLDVGATTNAPARTVAIEPATCEHRTERDFVRGSPEACAASATPPAH